MWNVFIYSFSQQIVNECLLFPSHCSKRCGQNGEKKARKIPTLMTLMLSQRGTL